jgi:hypothetical protein
VTGIPWSAFVPAGAFGIVIVALAMGLDLSRKDGLPLEPALERSNRGPQ